MISVSPVSFHKPAAASRAQARFEGNNQQKPKVSPALEWLETSGDGSYASRTVGGAITRRYHGDLVASLYPPVDRHVLVSRMDETLKAPGGQSIPLSTNLFDGQDEGELYKASPLLDDFTVDPIPTWTYKLPQGEGTLTKQLALKKNQATMVMGYTLSPDAKEPVELEIRPFVNRRGFHFLSNTSWHWTQEKQPQGLTVKSGGVEPVHFQWKSSRDEGARIDYQESGHWYWNYKYQREADRGLDSRENNYSPGSLRVTLQPGETVSITASSQPLEAGGADIKQIAADKSRRLAKLLKQTGLPDTPENRLLVRAADQFIVHRKSVDGPTVLAGYHWFNDWGRDTMIALPGLTLATRRFKDAEGILNTFARYAKNGMLPNNFPDSPNADPGYNTLDASMWWFHAVDAYKKAVDAAPKTDPAHTFQFLKGQYQKLEEVVTHHLYGRHTGDALIQANPALKAVVQPGHQQLPVGSGHAGIGMEPDGLIAANDGQLTWMDAADNGWAFTPRGGKPVEINALWYNGLNVMAELSEYLKDYELQANPDKLPADQLQQRAAQYDQRAQQCKALADVVKQSLQKYWDPQRQTLKDLLDSPHPWRDEQIRPNQIFALSLPHRAFTPEQEKAVLKTVEDRLLTPFGLRSLDPADKEYAPWYPNAGPKHRDSVYHQGPVWSWLIGPYMDALRNVKGDTPQTRQEVREKLQPLIDHMMGRNPAHIDSGSALGGIAEIFDGTAPHYSKGTVNQAWSVSEVLRQLIEISQPPQKKA